MVRTSKRLFTGMLVAVFVAQSLCAMEGAQFLNLLKTASRRVATTAKNHPVLAGAAGTFVGGYLLERGGIFTHECGHKVTLRVLYGEKSKIVWSMKPFTGAAVVALEEMQEKGINSYNDLQKYFEKRKNFSPFSLAKARKEVWSEIEKSNNKNKSKNGDIKAASVFAAGPVAGTVGSIVLYKGLAQSLKGVMKLWPLKTVLLFSVANNLLNLSPIVLKQAVLDGAGVVLSLEHRLGYDAKKYILLEPDSR